MRLRLMLVAAALFLSSCWWVGPPFYKGNPADPGPIGPGLYRVDMDGDKDSPHAIRIAWRADGSLLFSPIKPRKGDRAVSFVMVRFAVPGRALWIVQSPNGASGSDRYEYGLAEMRGDTLVMMPAIDCDSTADIVRAAGGTVSGGNLATNDTDDVAVNATDRIPAADPTPTGQDCSFPDRVTLERALRAYVTANPNAAMPVRLTRIGK